MALRRFTKALNPFACAVAMGLLAIPNHAALQDTQRPYKLVLGIDIPVMAVSALTWTVPNLWIDQIVAPSCPCSSSDINSFDRGVAGHYGPSAVTASNIVAPIALALPLALDTLDISTTRAPWIGYLEDIVVMGQSVLVAGAMTEIVKLSAQRPRPFVYDQPAGAATEDPKNYLSFFSAHTSTVFAATMSYATTFAFRHPGSSMTYVAYGAAFALGATTGALRIAGGMHFPTDVLAGAVVGTVVGIGIPWLHRRKIPFTPTLEPTQGGGVIKVSGLL